MPTVWKEGLLPGEWTLPDGRRFRCTEQDLDHYYRRTKDYLATGAPLPWGWEHHPELGPTSAGVMLSEAQRLAGQAMFAGGLIRDVRRRKDGVDFLLEVNNDQIDALKRAGGISPEIRPNVYDSYGRFWPGCTIAHIAVTPRPIQWPQKPFEFDPLKPVISLSAAAVPISLSQASYRPAKDKSMAKPPKTAPEQPGSPPVAGAAGADLDTDTSKDEDTILNSLDDDEDSTPMPGTAPTEANGMADVAGDTALIHKLSQSIAALGMVVEPTPGMDLRNYIEHLCTAVATHKATKDLAGADDPATPKPVQTNQQAPPGMTNTEPLPEIAEVPPVMLSQAQAAALQAENEALKKETRKAIDAKIRAMFSEGLLSKDHANALIAKLRTVSLSATAAGLVDNDVLVELRIIEQLAKDGKLQRGMRHTTVALSQAGGELETAERIPGNNAESLARQEKAGDELADLAGVPRKR